MDIYTFFMNNGKYFWKSRTKCHVEKEDFIDSEEAETSIAKMKANKMNRRYEEAEREKEKMESADEEYTGDW